VDDPTVALVADSRTPLSVSSSHSLAESKANNDGLAKPPVEAAERLGNGSKAAGYRWARHVHPYRVSVHIEPASAPTTKGPVDRY